MKAYYKNNLKKAYLVLEGEEQEEESFQATMLQENEIPWLLKTHVNYINDMVYYHYDISGKMSLRMKHEKEKLKEKDIKQFVQQLLHTIKGIQKYMLEGSGLLLDPNYIFCERDKYVFCYYPPNQASMKEKLHKLTEFFVKEVDYRDKEGVYMAYTLHKATMEENYSVERIMEEIASEKGEIEQQEEQEEIDQDHMVDYQELIEHQLEEPMSVAEKNDFWKPVKNLLDRKKKEKWGYWDDIHIEEDDL